MDRSKAQRTPGFFGTWFLVTFSPKSYFKRARKRRSTWSPVLFALVVGAVAEIGFQFTDSLALMFLELEDSGEPLRGAFRGLVIGPFQALVRVYLWAAVLHWSLRLLRLCRAEFRTTVECCAWAGAPLLFAVVPFVGSPVGLVWSLVVLAIATRQSHAVSALRALVVSLIPLSLLAFGLMLLRAALVAYKIPSGAMLPTVDIGDHVYVNTIAYASSVPRRGDVIAFRHIDNATQKFVKRVVALPGDVLESVEGRLVINGWRPPECHVGRYQLEGPEGSSQGEVCVEFLGDEAYLTMYDERWADPAPQGPWVVGSNEVWVVGDNRNNSSDSRTWRDGAGAGVPESKILGRVWGIWLGFRADGSVAWNRLGSLSNPPRLPQSLSNLEEGLRNCLERRPPAGSTLPPGRK